MMMNLTRIESFLVTLVNLSSDLLSVLSPSRECAPIDALLLISMNLRNGPFYICSQKLYSAALVSMYCRFVLLCIIS